MQRLRWQLGVVAMGWVLASSAEARQAPPPPDPSGVQTLTQGPLHEAFAAPVIFDPKPGPVVPKAPPSAVPEAPPDEKPAGDDVRWIPGYWAWDDSRNDFLWISGVWRAMPPGRQWTPGYWQEAGNGYQWVAGFWSTPNQGPSQYLPQSPASLENGPNSPAPVPAATWSPGLWVWQSNQYLWRPGFWVMPQPGWMWIPAMYVWSPYGYVYTPGYWDYPIASRGTPFAPIYYAQPVYAQPGYVYTPAVGLLTAAILTSLFVRPACGVYYFGDYYAQANFQVGIYPFYSFHGSRYGYDPIFVYTASQNIHNPGWAANLHEVYAYRREHIEARPPHTYGEMRAFEARSRAGNFPGAGNAGFARPLHELAAARSETQRFERLDQAQRQVIARQANQLHEFREERSRLESQPHRASPVGERAVARNLEMPRSPLAAIPTRPGTASHPPSSPAHAEINHAVRPGAAEPTRHEPHPQSRPPSPHEKPAPRR